MQNGGTLCLRKKSMGVHNKMQRWPWWIAVTSLVFF